MALSGLLILVASVAFAVHHSLHLQRRFFEVKRRATVQEAKIKISKDKLELAKKLHAEARLVKSVGSTEISEPGFESLLVSSGEILNTTSADIAQLGISGAELNADCSELTSLAAFQQKLNLIAYVGGATGLILLGCGIFLWYTKVQILLDQALAIQSAAQL